MEHLRFVMTASVEALKAPPTRELKVWILAEDGPVYQWIIDG